MSAIRVAGQKHYGGGRAVAVHTAARATLAFVLLAFTLSIAALADAQAQTRIRGTISNVSADVISVRAGDGKNVDVHVGDKTSIISSSPLGCL